MIALDAKYALLLPHQTVCNLCNERLYEKKKNFKGMAKINEKLMQFQVLFVLL